MDLSGTKVVAGAAAVSALAQGAAGAVQQAERVILGVPQSVLLVALAGALIGVLLLPGRDADRLAAERRSSRRKAWNLISRLLGLAAAVVAYAFVAAWLVDIASALVPALRGAPELPLAGISGVTIRRMLPGYLRVLDTVTGAVGGKKP